MFRTVLAASLVCVVLPVVATAAEKPARGPETELARQILDATGLTGGLIVHVGSGDGKLTAALRAGESYVVHGLDTDPANVARAREHLQGLGIYGPASVDRFDGKHLPYAENLVNLVVAEDLGGVTAEEAMRVLAPGGVLYVKQGGRWQKTVKPRPATIDEWTHFLHDASGNAVAHDELVGPPRHLQWTALPLHTRSHEHVPSIYAVVSSGGRIFYIADEAPILSIRRTPQWRLVARDAFNGLLLWKQPIDRWFPHIVNWGGTPNQLQRKLVAAGDRVYVTLGLCAPLCAVDAATGETLETYESTEGTEEIVLHQGTLLLVVRKVTDERVAELARWTQLVAKDNSPVYTRGTAEPLVKSFRQTEAGAARTLVALDAASGRLLWKKPGEEVAGLRTLTLCAEGDRVFFHKGGETVCADLSSGRTLWSVPAPPLALVHDGTLFCAGGQSVTALSANDGKTLWTQPASLVQIRDVFVAGGSLWLGGFKPWQGRSSGKRGPAWGPYFATQRDPATGEILRRVEPENPGHHHRCYRNKATDRYIMAGRRGTEFVDLETGEYLWNSWARGVCKYGVMPCNGLLYAPPHACGCYITAKLTGFNALAAGEEEGERERGGGGETGERLERGPAFGRALPTSRSPLPTSADWPTYRHDAERTGYTPAAVPAVLKRRWQAKVGAKLTAPTVCGGKVFVASVDDHRVCAIDADSGRPAWRFTAGARVDSPPSAFQGRAIFGCRDGYVYSLRASDGAVAWRLQAAREDRRIAARGQLESVWPVHGSVLVRDGTAYFTAGRSSYLDGGLDLYRVAPDSGKTLSKTAVYSPDPETHRQPPQSAPSAMPGTRSDILAADGECIYLRDMVFDPQGKRQGKGNAHLFTLTDFLDDSWPHRSYWVFGTRPSISTGCSGRDRNLIYGRLLVFDGQTIYGYGRANVHWSNQLEDGPYRLFAVKRGGGTPQWAGPTSIQVRAMVLAGKVLFAAGPPAKAVTRPEGPGEDRGAVLVALSAADGSELARCPLDAPPVFDGMAAAGARLYVALENGQVVCMDGKGAE